jgi:hypothetical protein
MKAWTSTATAQENYDGFYNLIGAYACGLDGGFGNAATHRNNKFKLIKQ